MGRPPRGIPGNPGRPDLSNKDEVEVKDAFRLNFGLFKKSEAIPGENACGSAKPSHKMSLCHGVTRGQGGRERRPGGQGT